MMPVKNLLVNFRQLLVLRIHLFHKNDCWMHLPHPGRTRDSCPETSLLAVNYTPFLQVVLMWFIRIDQRIVDGGQIFVGERFPVWVWPSVWLPPALCARRLSKRLELSSFWAFHFPSRGWEGEAQSNCHQKYYFQKEGREWYWFK